MRRKIIAGLVIAALLVAACAAPAFAIFGVVVARAAAHVPAIVSEAWRSIVIGVQSSARAQEATLAHALHNADISAAGAAVGRLLVLASPALALAVLALLLLAWSARSRKRRASG